MLIAHTLIRLSLSMRVVFVQLNRIESIIQVGVERFIEHTTSQFETYHYHAKRKGRGAGGDGGGKGPAPRPHSLLNVAVIGKASKFLNKLKLKAAGSSSGSEDPTEDEPEGLADGDRLAVNGDSDDPGMAGVNAAFEALNPQQQAQVMRGLLARHPELNG